MAGQPVYRFTSIAEDTGVKFHPNKSFAQSHKLAVGLDVGRRHQSDLVAVRPFLKIKPAEKVYDISGHELDCRILEIDQNLAIKQRSGCVNYLVKNTLESSEIHRATRNDDREISPIEPCEYLDLVTHLY